MSEIILITGPAGSGKTLLGQSLFEKLTRQGESVVWCDCGRWTVPPNSLGSSAQVIAAAKVCIYSDPSSQVLAKHADKAWLVIQCGPVAAAAAAVPVKKPPLGIRPAYVWHADRMREIAGAVRRYRAANQWVPHEWLMELAECAVAGGVESEVAE